MWRHIKRFWFSLTGGELCVLRVVAERHGSNLSEITQAVVLRFPERFSCKEGVVHPYLLMLCDRGACVRLPDYVRPFYRVTKKGICILELYDVR